MEIINGPDIRKMASNKRLSLALFSLVLLFVSTISVIYLSNIYSWKDYPDFGFVFRVGSGIGTVGMANEHGQEAGLHPGDRIISVNGKSVSTLAEFRGAMNRKLGESNTYLLERGGEQISVSVHNEPIGFSTAFSRSGFLWLLGVVYIGIGAIVFLMKRHDRTSWIFYLFTVTLGLYTMFLLKAGLMAPTWLETINIFNFVLVPAVTFHLALCFPAEKEILKRNPRIQYLPYVLSVVLFAAMRIAASDIQDIPPALRFVGLAYLIGATVYFLGSCIYDRFRSLSEIVRLRARVILLGSVIAVTLPLADFIYLAVAQKSIVPSYHWLAAFLVFFPLSIAYTIVRHNLFDFDAIIRRTYGYVLTTGTIAVFYGGFVLLSNVAFGQFAFTQTPAFTLLFILFIVFFFNPIRDRVQAFADRVFFRLEYNYQETVERISDLFRSLQKTDEVVKTMMDTVMNTLFIDSGSVLLLNKSTGCYECHVREQNPDILPFSNGKAGPADDGLGHLVGCDDDLAGLSIPAAEPLMKKIEAKKREVTIYDVEEDPSFAETRQSGKGIFNELKATVIVPLIYEDKLTGFMALGRKKSGKFYRKGDINLLNTLANQGAVAVENSVRLGEVIEKERMDEELSIARDLQKSMLPAAIPEIKGFGIAAHCSPAREVGGDFYDFISDDGSQLGIIVGDVTGKGVSGALVMSASRSVFRMLAEEGLGVGRLMTKANDRSKKDIREGMFVAVLYAVLHGEDCSVHLCSAGQTQPILYSSKTGRAEFIETVGDNFPLGIIEGVEYEETILRLEKGDGLVFYTDGVVEAVNEKGEMFGFERLLEAVSQAGQGNADVILSVLKQKVDAFVGKAPQHDDITIIVASVA
jgi:phosphoserine phosphatase RsbU/P